MIGVQNKVKMCKCGADCKALTHHRGDFTSSLLMGPKTKISMVQDPSEGNGGEKNKRLFAQLLSISDQLIDSSMTWSLFDERQEYL